MAKEIGVIKNGNAIFPYWGKRFNKITGLDPLGQQYASEKIYSHLLPGITNLTNRIRYYGFYCWLLKEYSRLNAGKLSKKGQRTFIRRAELTLAICMSKMDPSVLQIPGSSKASEIIENNKEDTKIDLSLYADDPRINESYWTYASGAFGQYYAASMEKIGLIKSSIQNIYTLTSKEDYITGSELADSYEANLSSEVKNSVLEVIKSGDLATSSIKKIYQSFNAVMIPVQSNEWKNYEDLLMGPDLPRHSENSESHRKNTIDIIFKTIEEEENITSTKMLNILFSEGIRSSEEKLTTEFAWFQYRLNEFWQFASGAIFWAALNYLTLKKGGICNRNELVNEIAEQMCSINEVNANETVAESLLTIDTDLIQSYIGTIKKCEKSNESVEVAQNALFILLMIFSIPKDQILQYSELLATHNLRGNGSFIKRMEDFHRKDFLNKPLNEFLADFLQEEILFRHKIVALKKLGKGTRSTLKFEMEGELMLYEGNFSPSLTNPRIETLFKMLSDLKILKEDNQGGYSISSGYN